MSGAKPIRLSIKAKQSPWDLTDCSVYRHYFCPENDCHFMCPDEPTFRSHMTENHLVIERKIKLKSEDGLKLSSISKSVNVTKVSSAQGSNFKKSGIVVDCRSCGFAFDSVADLRQHIQDEHTNSVTVAKPIPATIKPKVEIVEKEPEDNDGANDYFDDNNDSGEGYNPATEEAMDEDDNYRDDSGDEDFIPDEEELKRDEKKRPRSSNKFPIPVFNFEDIKTPPQGPITKVRCDYCAQDYRSYFYLKGHSEREHPDLPIKFTKRTVKVLNEMTGKELLIKEVDGNEATFKCTHCDYVTTHQHLRGLHMQKEHNDVSKLVFFKCDQCDLKFKQRRSLKKHKEDHKSGKIENKKKLVYKFIESTDSGPIKIKFKDMELQGQRDMIIIPSTVMLICLVCEGEKELRNFHCVKTHFEKNHPGQELKFTKRVIKGNDGLEDFVAGDTPEGQPCEIYKCDHCDFATHMADVRGIHMEKDHNDGSKLVFAKCDKCDYRTKSRGNLVNHKRIVHEGYKPKKCEHCDKRFSTKSLLEDHVMRVHQAGEILCNDCGKLFASPSALTRHELWHHNPEKAGGPVPCDKCGKISIHRLALQKHINRVHKKQERSKSDIMCNVCGKSYVEKKSLKLHMLKAHGFQM